VIIVDTNIILALTDTRDDDHERCKRWFDQLAPDVTLYVPPTVIAEVCYLVNREVGPEAEAAVLDDIGDGDRYTYQLVDLLNEDIRRMADLVRQYADREMGGTDASIVAVAERLKINTVATINRKDFDNVRPKHVPALSIVP